MKGSVHTIIRSFFGKQFPEGLRRLFGQWLQVNNDQQEKKKVMEELWEEGPSVATGQTVADWEALRKQIQPSRQIQKVSHIRRWQKYAAVILLLIATGVSTFFITRTNYKEEMAELLEFNVPYGESRYLELADGSGVWVNAGSFIIYPEKFTGDNRTVFISGEASFTVTHDSEKPFRVKSHYLDVEVLGTVFTVKSYPNDYYSSATLEEGSVSVSIKADPAKKSLLQPGQQLIYTHADQSVQINTVDLDLYRMEKKGYLIFDNTSFRDLVNTLERKYNVTIHYDAQKYGANRYNVKFAPDETLEEAMEVLRRLVRIEYKINGNVLFIN